MVSQGSYEQCLIYDTNDRHPSDDTLILYIKLAPFRRLLYIMIPSVLVIDTRHPCARNSFSRRSNCFCISMRKRFSRNPLHHLSAPCVALYLKQSTKFKFHYIWITLWFWYCDYFHGHWNVIIYVQITAAECAGNRWIYNHNDVMISKWLLITVPLWGNQPVMQWETGVFSAISPDELPNKKSSCQRIDNNSVAIEH